MINMVNYKIKKDKSNGKRKLIVIGASLILIILAIVLVIALWPDNSNTKEPVPNTSIVFRNVNGKLASYIISLGNEYYIKYTGKFGKSDFNTSLVDATVEFTAKNDKNAIYSNEINMHVVIKGEDTYNILNKQKMLFKSKLPLRFSTEPYNLISDFGQIYVKDDETKIDGVKYVYQEYTYDKSVIRYYFAGEQLSHIRIISDGQERKINIRVDKKAKEELFNIPSNYNTYDI